MATYEPSDELSFEEFKRLMASAPFELTGAEKEFADFLNSGCSEREAKRWLTTHIWRFPESVREGIMRAFAIEMLEEAAAELAPPLTEAEAKRRFMHVWDQDGFEAAVAWVRRQDWPGRRTG